MFFPWGEPKKGINSWIVRVNSGEARSTFAIQAILVSYQT